MYNKSSPHKNHFNTFVKGAITGVAGTIIVGIIAYLTRRYLALNLTTEEYGFFYSAFSMISLILVFLDLGIGNSITILVAKYITLNSNKKVNSIFSFIFFIKTIAGILSFIILILLSKNIVNYYFKFPSGIAVFSYLAFLSLLIPVCGIFYGVLIGEKKFFWGYALNSLYNIVLFIIVILFTKKIGLNAPATGYILGYILVFIIGAFAVFNGTPPIKLTGKNVFSYELFKEIFSVGIWLTIGIAGINIMYNMDTLMLAYLTTLNETALYNIALPIMTIFQSLLTVLPSVFAPLVVELWNKNDPIQIGELTNGFMTFMLVLGWIILFFIIIFAKDIISVLFSSSYHKASTALIILCAGACFYTIVQFFVSIFNGIDKAKYASLTIVASVVINIILNYILIPLFSINGAAMATTISYFITAIFMFIILKKKISNMSFNLKRLISISTSGLLCIILILYFSQYISHSIFTRLLFSIILYVFFLIVNISVIKPIIFTYLIPLFIKRNGL